MPTDGGLSTDFDAFRGPTGHVPTRLDELESINMYLLLSSETYCERSSGQPLTTGRRHAQAHTYPFAHTLDAHTRKDVSTRTIVVGGEGRRSFASARMTTS